MENIMPTLDMKVLQEKANEYAMKGAMESLKDYYTGYNSVFRNMVDEVLKKQQVGFSMELPDIIALLNEKLSNEIDIIANEAVARTFIPQMKLLLTRVQGEVKFSDFLREFIDITNSTDMDDVRVSIEKHQKYAWLDIKIEGENCSYDLTLHTYSDDKNAYRFLSLPYSMKIDGSTSKYKTMSLKMDGAVLEIPFTRDVLSDRFVSYIARMIICKTKVIMDCDDFSEDMFPERCHCD